MENNNFDVLIIGGGAAGMTAGIYLSRAKIKTLILNEGIMGGQMILTHEVANYPGVESISGFMLARNMQTQAEKFGCKIQSNIEIKNIKLSAEEKSIELSTGEIFFAKSVIIATGGKSRTLGVTGEKDFTGRGISYCATCDGDFFTGKEIIVVGGGNSALEEAVSLTQYATKVTVVHQFDHFQAYSSAVEEAQKNPKISFIMSSKITEFGGEESLKYVKIKSEIDNSEFELQTNGAFIFVGYVPQTEKFKNIISLNNYGEILTDENLQTNIEGVFAAGDSRQKRWRQITTAVADGTIAALNSIEYLNSKKH